MGRMWPEVERVKIENRHELILYGNEIKQRLDKDGLDFEIFNLTTLNYLNLHEIDLKQLPDNIAQLLNLQSLVLHTNQLNDFNDNITKLIKLKLLDLSRNELISIPGTINNLVNLTSLILTNNQIQQFPKLIQTNKLTVIDLSNNKLMEFPDLCYVDLLNLSEIRLCSNLIKEIPGTISVLPSLKILELTNNHIKQLPGELADCSKLKTLNLKNNPISDRRLLKLIDQCRTKQIIDYIKQHCKKTTTTTITKDNTTKKNNEDSDDNNEISNNNDDNNFKYQLFIRSSTNNDSFKIIIDDSVKNIREYFLGCIINNVNFDELKFKKFIQLQNKLHETVCNKRNNATIATHDFNKIMNGDLIYTTQSPDCLKIKPLNRTNELTAMELFKQLQNDANNLRKEKKRNTYSGIHKYLYLLEGKTKFPCLLNNNNVLSLPPITNSDLTKITIETKKILVEITSSISLDLCKTTMNQFIKESIYLFDNNNNNNNDNIDNKQFEIEQVRTYDRSGNLKVCYPSKVDLNFHPTGDIKVIRSM